MVKNALVVEARSSDSIAGLRGGEGREREERKGK